jgi:hypothetical protein
MDAGRGLLACPGRLGQDHPGPVLVGEAVLDGGAEVDGGGAGA